MITQDVMQIYTAHRQNTLYPNFATLNYKEKKFASFFSGMQTTEYVGAPNFIVALITSEESEESLNLLHEVLPNISTTLLTTLFERLPKVLEELQDINRIIVFAIEQDIGGIPVFIYPDVKVSTKFKSDIFNGHFKPSGIEKKCLLHIKGEKFASIFTGTDEEKYIMVPNCVVTFLMNDKADPQNFKRKLEQYAHRILSEISNLLAHGLGECNEKLVDLTIKNELKENPLIAEKDFEELSKKGEPEVMSETKDDILTQSPAVKEPIIEKAQENTKSIDEMLAQIKMKTELKTLELEEKRNQEQLKPDVSASPEDLLNQTRYLQDQITILNEKIEMLNQNLIEKDQTIKKLTLILKSIRNYVSY